MLSENSLQIIRKNSKLLQEIESINEPPKQLAKTIEAVSKLSDTDDPYFKGYLYGILINLYLKANDSKNVVRYVNKLLLISGMALYEYCGKYCPFTKEKIQQILHCYLKEEVVGNYSELWGKGRILQLQNKYKEEIETYNKIIQNEKSNINAYRMCARVYEEMEDFSNALSYFEKADSIEKDPLTSCMIANIYIKQYDSQKAKTILLNTIKNSPDNSYPEYRLIEVLHKLGEKEELSKKRNLLLEKNPGNTKYILHTITDYNESILKELQQLQECFSEGIVYTSVNEYLGNYYNQQSLLDTNKRETAILNQNKAIGFYKASIAQNKFYYQSYNYQLELLMKKTENIQETQKEDNSSRINLIKTFKELFPYAVEDNYYFTYADSSLEEQMEVFEKAIQDYPSKPVFYHYLAECYLKKSIYSPSYKHKLIDLCKKQSELFNSSFSILFDCCAYSQKLELYDLSYSYIKKALKFCNNNKDVLLIAEQIKYFIAPDTFDQFIEQTEKKFRNEINEKFYLELSYFYFNKCYEQSIAADFSLNNTIDYCKTSLLLFEKALTISENIFYFEEVRLVYALLLYANQKTQKAYTNYKAIDENKLSLLEQINVCGDIFDIHILFELYSHKHKDDSCRNVRFWTFVFLYLLRYNLFKDQKYTISHYTSIRALSSMLSDKQMTSFRLYSLGSANDPKEGIVFYDYLAKDIKDKDIYFNLLNNQETDFSAVQASFTTLQDALTMFRLYGKREKNEGTGVNLVFNENFFSDSLKTPLSEHKEFKGMKNDEPKTFSPVEYDLEEPLYWILYWDKNSKMYFNPQGIYKTLEIELTNNKTWYVLNHNQEELQTSTDNFYAKYAQNISFTLNQIKNEFKKYILQYNSLEDIHKIKEILLNISYLIKDASFYDEKELRIIRLEKIKGNDTLKHDDDYFTLYKDYSQLKGFYRYPNSCPLEKIIIGPKVEQKETLREYLLNHLGKAGMNFVKVEFSKAPLA